MKKIIVIFIVLMMIFVVSVSSKQIKIIQNHPPEKPVLLSPKIVVSGNQFLVSTVTKDPDNDNVYYRFNNNYEWKGPFKSSSIHIEKIRLIVPVGNYTLGVQSKDIYDAESDWTYVEISVIKTKTNNFPFLFQIIQQIFKIWRK